MSPGLLLILLAGIVVSACGVIAVRRFIPPEKLAENNEYVGFTFSILSLVYGIFLAFTIVVVWQEIQGADEKVTNEVVLVNALWRNSEPFAAQDRLRIHRHLIEYVRDVIEGDYPKMEHGLTSTENAKYDAIWTDYFQLNPDPSDIRQVTFYRESLTRLNDFSSARRLRILSSNDALPASMWALVIVGAIGTIMFTWFYGTRYLSIQIAATTFLTAVIIYGVLLVSMLEYPFGGELRVSAGPYEELLHVFEKRMKVESSQR